jgi:hypothetical protein
MVNRFCNAGFGLLGLGVLLASIGCGSGTAKLRVLNASPDEANVEVLVDGTSIDNSLAFAASTGYVTVDSGSRHLQIEPAGSTTYIVDQTLSLNTSSQTTFLMTGYASSLTDLVLSDDITASTTSGVNLRLVNAAPSMGTADVYVVTPGTVLSGTSPAVSGLAFGTASSYLSLSTGTYEIYFTEPGTTFPFVETGSIAFSANQNRTLVALTANGGFTTITLADLN